MNTYWEERQKEEKERRYWMKNFLVEANCYADALRLQDLLEDGLDVGEAETDSGAKVI